MSKNSNKQLYMQLMEWLPTAFKSRKKRSKQRVNSKQSNRLLDGFNNKQSRLEQYEKRQ